MERKDGYAAVENRNSRRQPSKVDKTCFFRRDRTYTPCRLSDHPYRSVEIRARLIFNYICLENRDSSNFASAIAPLDERYYVILPGCVEKKHPYDACDALAFRENDGSLNAFADRSCNGFTRLSYLFHVDGLRSGKKYTSCTITKCASNWIGIIWKYNFIGD